VRKLVSLAGVAGYGRREQQQVERFAPQRERSRFAVRIGLHQFRNVLEVIVDAQLVDLGHRSKKAELPTQRAVVIRQRGQAMTGLFPRGHD
jgi:hypothetical protein